MLQVLNLPRSGPIQGLLPGEGLFGLDLGRALRIRYLPKVAVAIGDPKATRKNRPVCLLPDSMIPKIAIFRVPLGPGSDRMVLIIRFQSIKGLVGKRAYRADIVFQVGRSEPLCPEM